MRDNRPTNDHQVLGLAYMVMSAKLPVRLRVLVPAVENAIDGGAYRNGDIIKVRKGWGWSAMSCQVRLTP